MREILIRESDLAKLPLKRQEMARKVIAIIMETDHQDKIIRSPEDVARLNSDLLCFDKEHFVVVLLNTKNYLIDRETISIGSLNSCIVHPREVFKNAIKKSAASIICVHNHPSGDPTPSPEDVEMTHRLIEAGRILGIEVLDHVVLGMSGYVSLKEQGLI